MKAKSKKSYPERAASVPVTQKMLYGVRDELKSDLRSIEHKISSGEHKMSSRFEIVDSKFEKLYSEIHQMKFLIEEQNAKNNVVLDGLTSLYHRQESTDNRLTEVEKTLFTLK